MCKMCKRITEETIKEQKEGNKVEKVKGEDKGELQETVYREYSGQNHRHYSEIKWKIQGQYSEREQQRDNRDNL